ncbi:MAG: hypothetical protein KME21_20500 [Desmonostoc vinosum HA7617-LM4]|jgi:hypothetical protein|nr:hypothetical protein [Desmonostoc vinosum HA7617-LM4]
MQEIERFFSNIFSSLADRFRFSATNAAEQKIRETIDQQLDQRKKPKQNEQEDHKNNS